MNSLSYFSIKYNLHFFYTFDRTLFHSNIFSEHLGKKCYDVIVSCFRLIDPYQGEGFAN